MSSLAKNYKRRNLSFRRGKGSFLYTYNGVKFLDFVQGIAVNSLGHTNPVLVKAIKKQSQKLWHVSNSFKIPEGEELAKLNPQIVVKVPMIKEGIKAIKYFSNKGIKTNCTLVFSAGQALLAAKATPTGFDVE